MLHRALGHGEGAPTAREAGHPRVQPGSASICSVLIQQRGRCRGRVCKQAVLGKKKSVPGAWEVAAQPSPRRMIMQMGSLVRAEPF